MIKCPSTVLFDPVRARPLTFAFTGHDTASRVLVTRHGGRCTMAITGKTDVLVCCSTRSHAMVDQAKTRGLRILEGVQGLEKFVTEMTPSAEEQVVVEKRLKQQAIWH